MSTATATTSEQKLFKIEVFHYFTAEGERWRGAINDYLLPNETASRDEAMAQVQRQVAVELATGGTGEYPPPEQDVDFDRVVKADGSIGIPNPPPISDEELAEIVARLRARGHVGIGIFADDPGAFDLFDEIERQRDQHTFGGS
jgi:hypothetical protein